MLLPPLRLEQHEKIIPVKFSILRKAEKKFKSRKNKYSLKSNETHKIV